jgi:hypothetical protein
MTEIRPGAFGMQDALNTAQALSMGVSFSVQDKATIHRETFLVNGRC